VDGSKQLDEIVGDSYSPVARTESVMCLLAVGAHRGWKVCSYDVRQAYTRVKRPRDDPYRFVRLGRDITKVVVDLDPGMKEYVDPKGHLYVEWEWMIYGDKQAGRLWYDELMKVYAGMGFVVNKADPCLIHYDGAEGTVHGAVTVDDTVFTYSSKEVREKVQAGYVAAFGADGFTREMGNSFIHLGMRLTQDLDDGSISVD
jgi:hypothetical protein